MAEALYITKILVHVLCDVPIMPRTDANPTPHRPRWYTEAARLLFLDERVKDHPARVISEKLYPHLMEDAIQHGFQMVVTVLNEDLGSPQERVSYAQDVVSALRTGGPLNFGQVYLPLIVAGIIANTRVVMPRENVRESLFALGKAKDHRRAEQNEDNAFIFKMIEELTDREMGMDNF
ncbi:MAG: hypothetical protein HC915_13850 [Anaerolineae bacterium]|nr:hypothetical protein [Anaerolineae bacterium]